MYYYIKQAGAFLCRNCLVRMDALWNGIGFVYAKLLLQFFSGLVSWLVNQRAHDLPLLMRVNIALSRGSEHGESRNFSLFLVA
jgi:hypothetical protein